jgi:hypothetical protein
MDNVGSGSAKENKDTSLEERKFIQESQLRKKELELKEREVATKEAELLRSRWINPTVIGLFAATIGLFGNLIVAYIGNRNSQEIERSRGQSSLVVQAVGTGDAGTACKNLISFLRLGLLDDPKGTISRCETALGTIPVLPSVKTYAPVADVPSATELAPIVTSIDRGDSYHFEVTFTVPAIPSSPSPITGFDQITVYAYQLDQKGGRSHDTQFPIINGKWKAGERVTFAADLPKSYVNDTSHTSYLRFCVGSQGGCIPGPNLLLSRAQ